MSSRKIIAIIYVLTAVWIGISLSNAPKPAALPDIRLTVDETSNVLPKTPIVGLINITQTDVTINTCRDMQMIDSMGRTGTLPSAFCRTVTVPAKSSTPVPLFGHTAEDVALYQAEITQPTTIELTTTINTVRSTVKYEFETAGLFRTVFRHLFYNPVYNLSAALILIFPGYSLGWAIIVMTLIIRLILLVPQQKMLVSQRRMQAIQPKIQAIQEQHKGDQVVIGQKLMALYKQEGVNPLGSCLPILLQIPILIVLYHVISEIASPTNLAHLYNVSWLQTFRTITMDTSFYGLELGLTGGAVGIVLAVATGLLQFGQMWLANKRIVPAVKPQKKIIGDVEVQMPDMQKMQKNMMYIFPVMAAYFTYILPAGLGLYWLIGTVFMIVQQWFANRHVDDKKVVIRDASGKILN